MSNEEFFSRLVSLPALPSRLSLDPSAPRSITTDEFAPLGFPLSLLPPPRSFPLPLYLPLSSSSLAPYIPLRFDVPYGLSVTAALSGGRRVNCLVFLGDNPDLVLCMRRERELKCTRSRYSRRLASENGRLGLMRDHG